MNRAHHVWRHLGKPRLEEIVGQILLDRLEQFLSAIDPDYSPMRLFSSDGLSRVVEAFFGSEKLSEAAFREELFDSLPPELVDATLSACGHSEPGAQWNAKVSRLHRLWSAPNTHGAVATALGLEPTSLTTTTAATPSLVRLSASPSPYKPLKEYQASIFGTAMKKLRNPRSRFVIQMPTGSGKTRTAMEIIATLLNERPNGTVVIWLAHAEELCEQAYDCFADVWTHVATKPLCIARCWGSSFALPDSAGESAFIIGGFQKIHSQAENYSSACEAIRQRTALIVVDEAHKVIAPTYAKATRTFLGDESSVIGLTATPGRSAVNVEENEALASFFFNDIVGIECGLMTPLAYLREHGVLASLEHVPLISGRTFRLTESERAYLSDFSELPPAALGRIAIDDVRNVEIIRRLQRETQRGSRILFFACSIEHSRFICALLTYLGVSAAHLDGATNRSRRRSLIEQFKEGRIQVLCNYALLSTGFDAPKVDVVFISRPTQSIVLYSQMIGRGLRGPAIGGTESCRVIDVIDNIAGYPNEARMYHYFAEYFNTNREAAV